MIELKDVSEKIKKGIYIIILLVLCYQLFKSCNDNSELKTALLSSQKESIKFRNKLGGLTTENEVLEFKNKKLHSDYLKKDSELKAIMSEFSKVKTTTKIQSKIFIDTIYKKFDSIAPCNFVRKDSINKKWYSLNYKVDQNGIKIDSLTIKNTQFNIVSGYKRKWFLGKKTYNINVTSPNPYIDISDIKSTELKQEVKWYESTVFKVGVGIFAGILIAK